MQDTRRHAHRTAFLEPMTCFPYPQTIPGFFTVATPNAHSPRLLHVAAHPFRDILGRQSRQALARNPFVFS